MKLPKLSLILTLVVSTAFLQSCDSSTPLESDISENLFDRAKTLEDLLIGDEVNYTPISAILPIAQIKMTAVNEARFADFTFAHLKTGNYSFRFQAPNALFESSFIDARNGLYATDGALPGTPGGIDDSFRRILFRPGEATPQFTRIELENIVAQLIAADGGVLIVHPTEDFIVVVTELTIDHETFTNNDTLIKGRMRGDYTVSAIGKKIFFRRPTSDEVGEFNTGIRGLTFSHWIPTISENISIVEDFDYGNFELLLANQDGTISF